LRGEGAGIRPRASVAIVRNGGKSGTVAGGSKIKKEKGRRRAPVFRPGAPGRHLNHGGGVQINKTESPNGGGIATHLDYLSKPHPSRRI